MQAEIRPLPASPIPQVGEAIDGYLERLAAASGHSTPELVRRLSVDDVPVTFLTTAPDSSLIHRVGQLAQISRRDVRAMTLQQLTGIELDELDPHDRNSWRKVAARGWPPARGTALCPACLAEAEVWRIAWRHPWVAVCLRHTSWLLATCPSCGFRFRSYRPPLRPVDAPPGTCANSQGTRGRSCLQPLAELPATTGAAGVLTSQQRIWAAIHGHRVDVLGQPTAGIDYLAEVRAMTVLLLHLAIQPHGEHLASWADAARADHLRSDGPHGARWSLAPPADLVLRGHALEAADTLLRCDDLSTAAEDLGPWIQLAPQQPDGQLSWLADHTTMTPIQTRLIMAATAPHRRLSTLLRQPSQHAVSVPVWAIPQLVPVELYLDHLASHLSVDEQVGRLFAALGLALREGAEDWATAARTLELPEAVGPKTARTCTRRITTTTAQLAQAIESLAAALDPHDNYRDRELAVRRLATRTRWHAQWAHRHLPGSRATSRQYAIAWLWTTYARGSLDLSPGWPAGSANADLRARYRRYAARLTPRAGEALVTICTREEGRHDRTVS